MSKLRGIIIDDEKNGRNVLKKLIADFCTGVEIIHEARNIEDAYSLIVTQQPEFILLDIQMPGGSGFDLLKKFEKINFEIIFITSHNQYAINAFKYSAIDYLLKPVDIAELVDAVERVKEKRAGLVPVNEEKIVYLLNNLSSDESLKNIALQKSDKVFYIKLSEINYLEAESNYTKIYTNIGEWFIHSKTLKYFEDLLSQTNHFFRITRSHIVNIRQIRAYTKSEPYLITLSNGIELEISRRKKGELLRIMSEND
jgi:two-component system, LytTR family, response regulator